MSSSRRDAARPCTLALVAAAALTACGGGGSPPAGVSVPTGARVVAASAGSNVDEDSVLSLSAPLVRALLSTAGDELLDLTGGREQPQSSAPGSRTMSLRSAQPGIVALAALRSAGASVGRMRAQAMRSGTMACDGGGTMTVTLDDADGDDKLSAGDTLTTSAQGCVMQAMPAATGTLGMSLNVIELDADEQPLAVDMSVSFVQFTMAGYGSMSGKVHVWTRPEAGGDRTRIRYEAMTVVEHGQSLVYDFDVHGLWNSGGGTFELSGGLAVAGQTYAIVPIASFVQGPSAPPASGSLEMRDAAGDAIRLTARDTTRLDLQLLRGGGVVTEWLGRLWADYPLGS